MAQLEPGIPKSPQQESLPLRQQSPNLNIRSSNQPIAVEGNEAIIHDFLSLGGSKIASSSVAVAQNGLKSSISTQDLLQRAESNNALQAAFVLGNSKPHISSVDYNAGQQTAYNLVNGVVEMQPNYRSSDFSYLPKAHGSHTVSNKKHWQQQQKSKLVFAVSEDDDDEDDESLDHGYNSKKETGYQKFDSAQQPERKNMDVKGLTPRSKHSATEQRRRSKINDRFQMLRQLLPYSDQKRDKASFLLEVIEHIQMLHEKVKKYEAAEHLGQQLQETPKALLWDRTSGCKEGVIDVSYSPSPTYNIKDVADANGYMRYQSSPLRVGHGNGISRVELPSSRGYASPFANRLLQSPTCLSSYENNSLISKPAVLTFTTPPTIYGEEPATPTFLSSSQSLPEARTMFAQLAHREVQAAIRVQHPHSNEEATALPDLQQAGKSSLAQKSSFLHDTDCERPKSPEHRPLMHRDRRANEEMDEQSRSSPVRDMHQKTIGSTLKECRNDKGRASCGLAGTLMDMNVERLKGDCRGEALASDQGPSAVIGGAVNISSPYSQGLLDSITRALQRSGVDLSQASISVQIDLGKPSGSALASSTEIATFNTGTLNSAMPPFQSRDIGHLQESVHSAKRPKIEIDSKLERSCVRE